MVTSSPIGLVLGTDGNFYGTTANGGAYNNCTNACGTVFEITPSGTLTTMHSFDGADGSGTNAGLIQGTDGNFYGTTYSGGANSNGTIFKINAKGALTTLHSFDNTKNYFQFTVSLVKVRKIRGDSARRARRGGGLTGLWSFSAWLPFLNSKPVMRTACGVVFIGPSQSSPQQMTRKDSV